MCSKQNRKNPITTIAVSQDVILKLDEYLKGKNLSRKEFVEKSIDYFIRTGFDLNDDVSKLSPVQDIVQDLKEMQKKTAEQNGTVLNVLTKIFEMQKTYTQKTLPAQEKIQDAIEYKTRYGKIKQALFKLSENKSAVRVGQIKRIINEYLDL